MEVETHRLKWERGGCNIIDQVEIAMDFIPEAQVEPIPQGLNIR